MATWLYIHIKYPHGGEKNIKFPSKKLRGERQFFGPGWQTNQHVKGTTMTNMWQPLESSDLGMSSLRPPAWIRYSSYSRHSSYSLHDDHLIAKTQNSKFFEVFQGLVARAACTCQVVTGAAYRIQQWFPWVNNYVALEICELEINVLRIEFCWILLIVLHVHESMSLRTAWLGVWTVPVEMLAKWCGKMW